MARYSEEEWFKKALGRNTDKLRDLGKVITDNRDSAVSLTDSLISNANIIGGLQKSFMTSEKLQLRALSQGTTYSKFVANNTKAIDNSIVAQQAMTQVLQTSWEKGLRNNTEELNSMLGQMKFLDQNVEAMAGVFSEVAVLTGDSKDVQSNLTSTIIKTNKDYGVSMDKLGNSLQGFMSELEKYSLFGKEAVGNLASMKTSLMGMTGGKGGKQIDVLLSMLDASKIQEQALFGLTDLSKLSREGDVTTEKILAGIMKANEVTNSRLPISPVARALAADSLGRSQITAIGMLEDLLKTNNALTSEQKKNDESYKDTLKYRQTQVDSFYNTFAPGIHTAVTTFLPMMAAAAIGSKLGMAGRGLQSRYPGMGVGPSSKVNMSSKTMMGAGKSASMLGRVGRIATGALAFAGPIGIGIAALTTFGPMIFDALSDGNEEAKEQTKTLKELKAKSDDPVAYKGLQAATRMINQLNLSSGGPTVTDKILLQLKQMNTNLMRVVDRPTKTDPA